MEIAGVDLPHWLGAVAIICLLGLIPVTYLPEPWGRRRRWHEAASRRDRTCPFERDQYRSRRTFLWRPIWFHPVTTYPTRSDARLPCHHGLVSVTLIS